MASGRPAARFGTVLLPRHRGLLTPGAEVSYGIVRCENTTPPRGGEMSGFDSSRRPGVPNATDASVTPTRVAAGTPPKGRVLPTAAAGTTGGLTSSRAGPGRTNVMCGVS